MAETIPNQPIIFDYEDDCLLASDELKVMAQYGDVTQFQMKLEPCGTDASLIQNAEFDGSSNWSQTGSAWTIGSGQAVKTVGTSSQLFQSAPATDGTLVRLRFTLSNFNGDPLNVSWSGVNNFVSSSGTYEFWIESNSASSLTFAATGSTSLTITDLQLISVNTNFEVDILDSTDTIVDSLSSSDFDFSDGYFTASIDWESLSIADGCYTLKVADPCPCAQGGITMLDFTTSTNEWTISNGWTIASGTATFNDSSAGSARILNALCSGTEYSVTYTVTGVSATERFQVFLGGVGGVQRTSNGTYTETITSGGTTFRMTGTPSLGTATFSVTHFSIEAVDKETIQSNEIQVAEVFNCGTLALALCNDSDGLGFGFANTGFRPLMRLPASLNRSSYPMERLAYDNSLGRKSTYYSRSRVARELGFDGKYFMHDFGHLFGMADHFYIDDVEYFVEEDEYPSVSWGEFDDVGGVTINVSKKVQLIENRRLTSSSVGCSTDGSPIVDSYGAEITDQNDSTITTG